MLFLLKKLPAILGCVYAALFTLGMVVASVEDTPSTTQGISVLDPDSTNPGSVYNGGRVRVSSARFSLYHFPVYLIDEEKRPTNREKWVSSRFDKKPWVEILFRTKVSVSKIAVTFAGYREPKVMRERPHRIECESDGEYVGITPRSSTNIKGVTTHLLTCANTSSVRLSFDGPVSIYEILVQNNLANSTEQSDTHI